MKKGNNVSVHVDPEVKQEVDELLEDLCMTEEMAINLFFRQILVDQGLPFRPRRKVDDPKENTTRKHIFPSDLEHASDLRTQVRGNEDQLRGFEDFMKNAPGNDFSEKGEAYRKNLKEV